MKIELHAHTSEVSFCGKVPAKELIRLYKDAGYDCLVITNHFNDHTAGRHAEAGHPDFPKYYREEFEKAARLGQEAGLLVLCGYEIRFRDNGVNDYLVYGMPRDLEEKADRLFSMDPHSFGELARKRNFLFYQAHPFRDDMRITDPADLFGIEVNNAHPRHDSRNDMAKCWAERFHLHEIGGSDCHRVQDAGRAGILTEEAVCNMGDLVRVLRGDLYTVF